MGRTLFGARASASCWPLRPAVQAGLETAAVTVVAAAAGAWDQLVSEVASAAVEAAMESGGLEACRRRVLESLHAVRPEPWLLRP